MSESDSGAPYSDGPYSNGPYSDTPEPDEFDHYTTALLFGGPTRVVQVAVFMLHERRRVRISRATRRIEAVPHGPADPEDDPVQAAVLDEIPAVGRPLGQVIAAVAASPEVLAVADAMREVGLMRGARLRLRPTRQGRALRRAIAEELGGSRPERVAVLGPAGVEDARMREILEADDPKPIDLPHGRGRGRGHGGTGGGYRSGADGDGGDFGGGDGAGY
ncbi:TIGR04222 domain-containing membrane protein [Actinomadura sp. GTD37]|uniref:TIGR04222 domain-containing membrane protein n=1 Tax=Actinomadura sp. GTD37 TaxID=1778030 RepID=UPI0035BFDA77